MVREIDRNTLLENLSCPISPSFHPPFDVCSTRMVETGPKSFIVPRWTNKIRSLSIRRKFHLRGWTRRGRIKLSLRLKHSARRVSPSEGERRTNSRKEELFEESLPSFVKLSHLSEFLRKSIHPRQGKIRGRKRRRGFLCSLPLCPLFSSLLFLLGLRSIPSVVVWSVKKSRSMSSFSISVPLCPFHESRETLRKGWLTALIVLVVPRNGLLGFPSGFLQSSLCSPLFFQPLSHSPLFYLRRAACRSSNNCYSTPLLAKHFAERAHLVSQARDPRQTETCHPLCFFTSS